jgi:hypothetical protein
MSNDGKYIAFGFRYRLGSDMQYTMELWDAETLTKIKDFGSPGDIVEFRDIQISDDNQYVGFVTNSNLCFFDLERNHKELYNGGLTLSFSKDNKYFFIQQDTSWNTVRSYIVKISNYQKIYEYKKFSPYNYRFNIKNELFGGREKLLFFTNNWLTVSVYEPEKDELRISYTNLILSVLLPQNLIPVKIEVTDTLGKRYYEENISLNTGNELSRTIELPSDAYFFKLTTSSGQEITQKFIVKK